jgi:hypothetical protein
MSKLVALAALSVVVVAGCNNKESAPTTAPGAPSDPVPAPIVDAAAAAAIPAVDAAPPPVDAPDDPEVGRRAGKKTGLGAADEPVEVATEDLIKALAEKKVDAARLVDPAAGVYELWNMPGAGEGKPPPKRSKRHCGKKAVALVAKEAAFWIDRQKRYPDEPDMYAIECSNEFVATADPTFGAIGGGDGESPPVKPGHPLKYAVCYERGAGEYDDSPSIYFVPDASGQLKVAAILTTEVGAMDFTELNELSAQLAKTGKLCK